MIAPPDIRTETNRVSFSNKIGANCVNRTALDGLRRIEHYHLTLNHIREVGFTKTVLFPKA